MISLVRCDERLIHGQCMQFIVSDYTIRRIIVVDDLTAKNAILKSIFENAVPKEIKAEVYTTEDSKEAIRAAMGDEEHTLLLMKHPRTYLELFTTMEGLPKEVNIGSQMAKGGVKCVDYATLHPEDVEACKKLTDLGVRVYFNAVGASGAVTEWKTVAGKI
jgi:mannose/fructose/N-acetylgalactosamine-specific phosphotransferase system component IIB